MCQALPTAALGQLSQIVRHRKVPAGARILDPDDPSPIVANIVSGVVRLSRSLPDGRTQIVGLQFAPDFVGRPFSGTGGAVLAEAATPVELCCFARQQFEGLLRAYPVMQEALLKRVTGELDAAYEWMLLLGRKTAEERVARLLMLCAERGNGAGEAAADAALCRDMELPLSRTEMAHFLGLTLETVGRMLRRLAEAGVITIGSGRHITILDGARLKQRAEQEQD